MEKIKKYDLIFIFGKPIFIYGLTEKQTKTEIKKFINCTTKQYKKFGYDFRKDAQILVYVHYSNNDVTKDFLKGFGVV